MPVTPEQLSVFQRITYNGKIFM